MSDPFLDLQLRTLVVQYGRHNVLRALATLEGASLEQIEKQLAALAERRKARARDKKPPVSIVELAEAASRDHPAIADPLRTLAVNYHNRTFLPNLRDVHRFLEGTDAPKRKFKSREAAAPAVVRALMQVNSEDLVRLSSETGSSHESDFSRLARAIMRTPSKESDPADRPA